MGDTISAELAAYHAKVDAAWVSSGHLLASGCGLERDAMLALMAEWGIPAEEAARDLDRLRAGEPVYGLHQARYRHEHPDGGRGMYVVIYREDTGLFEWHDGAPEGQVPPVCSRSARTW